MAFRQSTLAPQPRARALDFHKDSSLEKLTVERARPQHLEHSPLSDFGSLNTITRSNEAESISASNGDNGEDLDSLDLQAFQDPLLPSNIPRLSQLSGPSELHAGAILPAHDGLGMFSASRTPNELWARSTASTVPERHSNSKRATHLTSSVDLKHSYDHRGALRLNQTRLERIEKWRLEQSEYTNMDKIHERARSRRQRRRIPKPTTDAQMDADKVIQSAYDDAPMERTTYEVIQDLLGVDDSVLCVILGEDLAPIPEKGIYTSNMSSPNMQKADVGVQTSKKSWRSRLLRQIREEMTKLAHQLSKASCCRLESESWTIDYAGMPIDWLLNRAHVASHRSSTRSWTEAIGFSPTFDLKLQRDVAEVSLIDSSNSNNQKTKSHDTTFWQQFSALRLLLLKVYHACIGQLYSPDSEQGGSLKDLQNPEALRRAAIIQQYHPLIARLKQNSPRSNSVDQPNLSSLYPKLHTPGQSLKRSRGSCASLNTKRSRRTTSEGESRNYWNLGGSLGTSSAIFAGVGAWGEL